MLGKNCFLEDGIHFKYDGIWRPGPSINIGDRNFIGTGFEFNIKEGLNIGSDNLIPTGYRFIDHDHGMATNKLMNKQPCTKKRFIIENDVWIGANVIILKGVSIESGATIAAWAVVNKSVPSKEIWGGVPAKKIGTR